MKNLMLCAVSALLASAALAEEAKPSSTAPNKKFDPVAFAAKNKERLARAGGMVEKPGAQQGKIVFIDTQDILSATNVEAVAKQMRKLSDFNIVYAKAKPGDPAALKEEQGANIAVIIVADDKTPPSLVAQEAGWAVLNVKTLDKNLKTPEAKAKFVESRYRKQLLRVYSLVCGGGSSSYPGNVMNAARIEDFDLYDEGVPMDLVAAHLKCAKSFGVTPAVRAPYSRACHYGWAPAPTNDVQRKIWDRYHSLPTAPITIKPESERKK